MQTSNKWAETVTIGLLNMSNTSTMMPEAVALWGPGRHSTWQVALDTHADAFYCNVTTGEEDGH
ncbi:hypothetical protein [Duganella levis]|uniref:hypothetical protein n=1 Tax=Duganella levis TaxID=2692169 RepID=UPI0019297662|nr:hypothetical protein [Duganella levis]